MVVTLMVNTWVIEIQHIHISFIPQYLSFLRLVSGTPAPADCELYHVDRDALFSGHALSEAFLQRLMSLYTAAHYRNQPNDLQMLSDAPAHLLFVLLGPRVNEDAIPNQLPDILCIIQVALEGV